MNKLLITWLIGSIINLLLMWFLIYNDFFEGKMLVPILWMCINFLPLSLILGYYYSLKTWLEAKHVFIILVIFLVLCLLSIYSRNFIPTYEGFIKALTYSPFLFLPFQIFIIFSLLRVAKLRNQLIGYFNSKNKDEIIKFIQSGNTKKALDTLLEETESSNKGVYDYLSVQKNILNTANLDFSKGLISKEAVDIKNAKVTNSLLEFLTPENK